MTLETLASSICPPSQKAIYDDALTVRMMRETNRMIDVGNDKGVSLSTVLPVPYSLNQGVAFVCCDSA